MTLGHIHIDVGETVLASKVPWMAVLVLIPVDGPVDGLVQVPAWLPRQLGDSLVDGDSKSVGLNVGGEGGRHCPSTGAPGLHERGGQVGHAGLWA